MLDKLKFLSFIVAYLCISGIILWLTSIVVEVAEGQTLSHTLKYQQTELKGFIKRLTQ